MATRRPPTDTTSSGNGALPLDAEAWLAIIQGELRECSTKDTRRDFWQQPRIRDVLWLLKQTGPAEYLHALSSAKADGVWELERVVEEHGRHTITSQSPGVDEVSAGDLMQRDFQPLQWLAEELLHEGMVLFGGKSKRGKSWVALNLAISVATGGLAFGHYTIPTPAKVLYCALEDGPRRVQRRLKMITTPCDDLSRLMLTFKMPPFDEGGLEYLTRHIEAGYGLIIIDVLAHLEKAGKGGLKNYHEVYETFAPLQALRNKHSFALLMVTHLRKSESEEAFDALHGSVAYQGAQDTLWVFERKIGERAALLHVRDKDAEDKVIELTFDDAGVWSFVGEGEEHTAGREEDKIIKYLREESTPQAAREIMAGIGVHPQEYPMFRKRLQRMVSKGLILRSDRGKYVPLSWGEVADVPF